MEHSAVEVDGESACVAGPRMKWVGKRGKIELSNFLQIESAYGLKIMRKP